MNLRTTFLLGALGLSACAMPAGTGANATATGSDVASVSFELTLGGRYQFDSVSYDISGNGFHRADSVNVSGSSSISMLVSGIPTGGGYVASLTAQDTAGKLTPCTGSATFSVASAAATVAVPVHMTCSVIQPATGSGGAGAAGTMGEGGASGAAGTMGGAGATGAGGSTPPAVPVPRFAGYGLAALLIALGVSRLRREKSS